jgi:spermidine synthase
MIFIFTVILACCSIVYELLLGQSLSAFLGNTVLRYSVTIGLYMLSMGIGSLIAEGRFVKHPIITLLKVEVFLTVTGGFSVILLHLLNMAGLAGMVFSGLAHLLIIVIGILTGLEIPLLMEVKNLEVKDSETTVLGVDYLGAFFGTVVFAFLFYPKVGLVPSAFLVGLLNAVVGVFLFTQAKKVQEEKKKEFRLLLGLQSVLLAILVICLFQAESINEFFIQRYLQL